MNATASPTLSPADSAKTPEISRERGGSDRLTLDFTRPQVSETIARATEKQTEEMPVLLDYTKWESWYDGFVSETASLPWAGQTMRAALSEFLKASVSGNEWRPDIVRPLKRAYEKYSEDLKAKGFDTIGKSEFVELLAKELKVIPAKLYKNYLNKEELEARARNFRMVANSNPGNSEIRKLRDLADTLMLSRSKFSHETSEKDPENPCVKLRTAIDELVVKMERSVKKPSEPTSILATPVSELVSRALSGFRIGKKEKQQ